MAAKFGHSFLFLLAAATLLLVTTGPARADAIDGDWCNSRGKHLSIRGPDIVTPGGGTHTKGTYDRHAFSYAVPAKESGAGTTINMILVDENTVFLRAGAAPGFGPGEAEVWHRCSLQTS